MNYKEKYNHALERASKLRVQNPFDTVGQMVEHIFPELKEDNNERIRKGLIKAVSRIFEGHKLFDTDVTREEALAWLENQEENKPTDKIEPMFHEGEWITNGNYTWKIVEVKFLDYILQSQDGNIVDDNISYVDKQFNLWTINDANDGDVLVDEDNNIGLYSGEKDDLYWHSCIYLGCDDYLRGSMGYHKHENTKPATKEQRELLFQKIQEAGYEWRQREKKLIKINEPKFKVGDWIVTDDSFGKIVRHVDEISSNIIDERYGLSDEYGLTYNLSFDKEHKWHKWTIQDAEDGDVLAYVTDEEDLWIMIYRSLYEPYEEHVYYHALLVNDNLSDKGTCCICIDNLKPATKEQRDLLFSKMKQEGYEWNAEKKEVKKIEPNFNVGDWVVKQDGENFWNGDYAAQITNITDRGEHWFDSGSWLNAKDIRLWTIDDAKDGDLIYVSTEIKGIQAIFHKFENGIIYFHCNLCNGFMQGGYEPSGDVKSVHPLLKTQHQKFFQKMKQAGYEWRQEEKKLIKINESKFKEGDFIVPDNITSLEIWKVINIDDDGYYNIQPITNIINTEDDETYRVPGFIIEKDYRLWSINDAKDGDVLVSGDIIFIFNNIHGMWIRCHCSLRKDGSFNDRNYDLMYAKDSKEVYPATKEQRYLLFSKMKQEGYEWNTEKKELSKQTLQITPKFCVGQLITDDNGTWYRITKIKCLDDWYYEVYDACEDTTHLELCSIIDEKFRENRL